MSRTRNRAHKHFQLDPIKISRAQRLLRADTETEAIERALDSEASCSDLLQRITAARGAISGLMAEVLEEHVREYLLPNDDATGSRQTDAAEELIEIIHSYLT